ncbi:dihydrolipoyl dehydrogenase [Chlamydiota bacterium]
MKEEYDIAIIGSGPAGYTAGLVAGKKGLKTLLVEKKNLGGTCLNVGCIPTKAIIQAAYSYLQVKESEKYGYKAHISEFDLEKVMHFSFRAVENLKKQIMYLIDRAGIEYCSGKVSFSSNKEISIDDSNGINRKIVAKNYIIASGSQPKIAPFFPYNGKNCILSKDLFLLKKLPEEIAIIGGGAIGVEFAYILNAFGVKTTILEMTDYILPLSDREISRYFERILQKKGIVIQTGAPVQKIDCDDKNCSVIFTKNGEEQKINANLVLSAMGRVPFIKDLFIENTGVEVKNGFISVNESFQTAQKNIYAIGDVISSPMLAHVAEKEAHAVINYIAGEDKDKIDYCAIPYAVYTVPQYASFGLSEEEVKKETTDYVIGKSFYKANPMAVATGETEGIVKIICSKKNLSILGAHLVGSHTTDLIHEILLARNTGITAQDIVHTIHAHPTFSEAIRDACRTVVC